MNKSQIIAAGIRAADAKICEEDKIWSRYSNDKVNIGEKLGKVIRTLHQALPLTQQMCALSIGSSAEPQFRNLETAFRAGLYLLDVDRQALAVVRERIRRQRTDHVATICRDYNRIFHSADRTRDFFNRHLHSHRMHLVTLHHSLYYCAQPQWESIFENLYRYILKDRAAIHAVLMSSHSDDPHSTTWLYNHFAGAFCGCYNDQDLRQFERQLKGNPALRKAQVRTTTSAVRFYVDDFAKFMSVVWMILLYPSVHHYSPAQKESITVHMYTHFWKKKRPLLQLQDHLVVYKGIRGKGLI